MTPAQQRLRDLRSVEAALDNLIDVVDAATLSPSLASYGAARATHSAAIVALGTVRREISERLWIVPGTPTS